MDRIEKLNYSVDKLFTKWFEAIQNMDSVFSLYFNTQYNPPRFVEARFLNLVQALEVYHRLKGKNRTIIDNKQYNKLVEEISEKLPKEAEWFKAKMTYLNEVSLRERLNELYDETKEIIETLLSDKKSLINKIVDIRNYYTHYSSTSKVKGIDGEEIYYISEVLSFMLKGLFLQLMGFSHTHARDLITSNDYFRQTAPAIQNKLSKNPISKNSPI